MDHLDSFGIILRNMFYVYLIDPPLDNYIGGGVGIPNNFHHIILFAPGFVI